MIIRLIETIPGDRFVSATGVAWTVQANDGTSVTVVAAGRQPYMSAPPTDFTVDVTNRDESLDTTQAVVNLFEGGITGRID